ncbi:MAG: hypothetical protein HYU70_09905 [Bacteroidetes bacterium]|nr:hypothetical protein [Bacteroidota bacterium]
MNNQMNTKPIGSLSDLRTEMYEVKNRLKEKEAGLTERLHQLPGEALKATVGGIVPLFLGGELASGAWKLAKGAFELIKSRKSGDQSGASGDWKTDLLGGAKKLGIFGALKLLFGLWRGK